MRSSFPVGPVELLAAMELTRMKADAPATKESATRAVEHLCDTEWDLRSAIHAFTVSFSSDRKSVV